MRVRECVLRIYISKPYSFHTISYRPRNFLDTNSFMFEIISFGNNILLDLAQSKEENLEMGKFVVGLRSLFCVEIYFNNQNYVDILVNFISNMPK